MHKIKKYQYGGQNGNDYFTPNPPSIPYNAWDYINGMLASSLQPTQAIQMPSTSQSYEAARSFPTGSNPTPIAPTSTNVTPNNSTINTSWMSNLLGGGGSQNAYNNITGISSSLTGIIGGQKQNEDPIIGGLGALGQSVLSQVNPAAGAANSVSNLLNTGIGKIFGKSNDYYNRSDQIFDKATDALNLAGPIGMGANFVLDGLNQLTGTTVKGVNVSDQARALSSSYQGTINQADKMGNRTFGGLSRLFGSDKRYRNKVRQTQGQVRTIEGISNTANDAFAASNNPYLFGARQYQLSGGYRNMAIGRNGMKLSKELEFARSILTKPKVDEVEMFQEGGKMNVIPEGALHARKNNMDIEGITKKGIPVVTMEEGAVVQQAEIEKNEIIFTIEVTQELERLMRIGTDEAAIEAGKLLVQEILHNTIDNTGLLEEVE